MSANGNFASDVRKFPLTEHAYRNVVCFHRIIGCRKPTRQRAAEIVWAHPSIFNSTPSTVAYPIGKGHQVMDLDTEGHDAAASRIVAITDDFDGVLAPKPISKRTNEYIERVRAKEGTNGKP